MVSQLGLVMTLLSFATVVFAAGSPGVPTNVTAVPMGGDCLRGAVALSWEAPSEVSGQATPTSYRVTIAEAASFRTVNVPATRQAVYLPSYLSDPEKGVALCDVRISVQAVAGNKSSPSSVPTPLLQFHGLDPIDISKGILSTDLQTQPVALEGDYRWSKNRKVPLGAEVYPGPLAGQVTMKWYPVAGVGAYNLYYRLDGTPELLSSAKVLSTVTVAESGNSYSLRYREESLAPEKATSRIRHAAATTDPGTGLLTYVISNLAPGNYRFGISAVSDLGESEIFPKNGGLAVKLNTDVSTSEGQGFMGRCQNAEAKNCRTFAANSIPATRAKDFVAPGGTNLSRRYFHRNFYRMNPYPLMPSPYQPAPASPFSLVFDSVSPPTASLQHKDGITLTAYADRIAGTKLPETWQVVVQPVCEPYSLDPLVLCTETCPVDVPCSREVLSFGFKPQPGQKVELPNLFLVPNAPSGTQIRYGVFLRYGTKVIDQPSQAANDFVLTVQKRQRGAVPADVPCTVANQGGAGFRITEVCLKSSLGAGQTGDLHVFFTYDAGNPVTLPLTIRYSPVAGTCPSGVTCATVQRTFTTFPSFDAPLLFPGAAFSSANVPLGTFLNYQVEIVDSSPVPKRTAPVNASFVIGQ